MGNGMNLQSILLLAVIILCGFLALRSVVKNWKKGNFCSGCGNSCGGGCSHCSAAGCANRMKESEKNTSGQE